ncbi:uncharacterized protein LOC116774757 [Danaus plexippus]|uniref:uncharacterized protein LOC116774757 n=1 Tax=Danaus plexippus TaxID=13037 RepID=UPI002AB001CB|nr:uncharacterized protein LOC116774757 [Danaus plexippus]
MASREIEDTHKYLLSKLLLESGLECVTSAQDTPASTSSSGEDEQREAPETVEEELKDETIKEETQEYEIEEIIEEEPEIFPTPSLRRLLPDKIRRIQEHNSIHVLPEEFKADIDPTAIPKIATTAQQKYIDILASITGCSRYKKSLAEYWFLDTLANLLRRAQEDEMNRASQAVLILWFCEWMKEMQHFDAADRRRMLRRFQDNILAAARFIAEEDYLPTPQMAGVVYKSPEEDLEKKSVSRTDPDSKHLVTFEGAAYECSLRDLTHIIHYIYDLFSTDYQYNLVRSVFTFKPEYCLIDTPHQIRNPKRLFAPLKLKPKKEPKSPKKDKPPAGKGKRKDVDTEEYLALLELRARDEREQDALEEQARESWHRRCHILPLAFAADDQFFDKYWPPPPVEPEPEPEPEVKGKKKGKK